MTTAALAMHASGLVTSIKSQAVITTSNRLDIIACIISPYETNS
jgi:hypothetical protein